VRFLLYLDAFHGVRLRWMSTELTEKRASDYAGNLMFILPTPNAFVAPDLLATERSSVITIF
jgi:hypothetical protein